MDPGIVSNRRTVDQNSESAGLRTGRMRSVPHSEPSEPAQESTEESAIVREMFGSGIALPTPPPILGRGRRSAVRRVADGRPKECKAATMTKGTKAKTEGTVTVENEASKMKKSRTRVKEPVTVKGVDGRYAFNRFRLVNRSRFPQMFWNNSYANERLSETIPTFDLSAKTREKRLKKAYAHTQEYGEGYYVTTYLREHRDRQREIDRSNDALLSRILSARAIVSSLHPAVCPPKVQPKTRLYSRLFRKRKPKYVGAFRPGRYYGRFDRNFKKCVENNIFVGSAFDDDQC